MNFNDSLIIYLMLSHGVSLSRLFSCNIIYLNRWHSLILIWIIVFLKDSLNIIDMDISLMKDKATVCLFWLQ